MMRQVRRFAVLIIASLFQVSCVDYELTKHVDQIPDINVHPTVVSFGAMSAGQETGAQEIVIENVGTDRLKIDDIKFQTSFPFFSITSVGDSKLDPGEKTSFILTYTPTTYSSDSTAVDIYSNDPDEPVVEIIIDGVGDAPVIEVTPDSYDFGNIDLGCYEELSLSIGNIGNVDLEIYDLEFFATLPVDFMFDSDETTHGSLPWTIPPSTSLEVVVIYEPLDLLDDSGYAEITSNDPQIPITTAAQVANGSYYGFVADSFEQTGDTKSDILFVIDNSCSMSRNQTSLKNNFSSFINVFATSGVDYQIAFITTDNESFIGGHVISQSSADPVAEVNNIIDTIGISGSPLERGLIESYEATSSGGDASNTGTFMRSDAKFVVIYISDEPDGSANYSSMLPSDYSNHLRGLKASSSLVAAHAVAGDYPSGCSGSGTYASFGDGYYDVVQDLGGTFLSICATDWGFQMDALARASMAVQSFNLSDIPIENTIDVQVDGIPDSNWYYDSPLNAVVFTTVPQIGSNIDVMYAIYGECE